MRRSIFCGANKNEETYLSIDFYQCYCSQIYDLNFSLRRCAWKQRSNKQKGCHTKKYDYNEFSRQYHFISDH